jgi:outer membrane receptor protein involved in Fe transport
MHHAFCFSVTPPRWLVAALPVLLGISTEVHAQAVQAPPNGRVATESVVTLSPFEVSADKDTGYAATNTLAGTRLASPIKDLGASLSILTKDLMTDLGASNVNDLLIYTAGMEAAGPGGNFSGSVSDINSNQTVGDAPRTNPQGSSRTRGLDAPNFTRGFFASDIPMDAYNTESVTVNRGPNAALFGVGSPAGVVDTALLRPNLRRDASKVEFRFGNNDAARTSVDFNRVLIPKTLAFRLAALHDDEKYNQRPAFEDTRRIYGAVTYEPFRSTVVRVNYEAGRFIANRPISVLPFNSIPDAWYQEGRQGFDWSYYDDPARNPAAAAPVGVTPEGLLQRPAGFGDSLLIVYSNPSARTPDLGYRSQLPTTASAAVSNAVLNNLYNPLVNRDSANDLIRALMTQNVAELAAGYWVGSRVLPGQQPNAIPAGIKYQGFTDYSAFDFQNWMLDETSRQTGGFRSFNVALEQRAWRDRVGVEVAYDRQRNERRSKNSFFSSGNSAHVRIDTTVTLPTGQPNPNLGRPYAFFGYSNWGNNFTDREALRATGFLRYDFKDLNRSWGHWLGRHSVTGLYEKNAAETINYAHRLQTDGPAALAMSPSVNAGNRRAIVMAYMGPSLIGNNNPLRLEPIRVPQLTAGPTVPVRYFLRAGNATDPGAFVDLPTSLVEINNGGNAQRDVLKSKATVLQSYWLRDHLVTMLGWRRDEDFFVNQAITFVPNPNDPNDPGKVHYGFNDFSFPRTPPRMAAGETKSYSAVLKWPQRLWRLPAGSDLSVFYNFSGNFSPAGGRVGTYGDPLPAPRGETKETGFNFSTLRDRVSMRLNWYETNVLGRSASNNGYTITRANMIFATAGRFWPAEGNLNPQNVPFMQAALAKLFSAFPANYAALHKFTITGTAPNISTTYENIPNVTDTTDYTAKGIECDLVFNPTSQWRILMNVAKQESVQSNSFPAWKELIARLTPVWNSTVTDPVSGAVVPFRDIPLSGYPLGSGPGTLKPGTVPTYGENIDSQVFVPYATALATEGSVSAEQRKWRYNLVTSYAFKRGSPFGEKLKGLSVGGGLRWQDRLGIGYPATRNPNGSVNLDLKHPYYAPPETNVDFFTSYERKILGDRVGWRIQLNIRNLIADDRLIPITVQSWGETATVRLPPERRWFVTNSFSF